MIGKEKRREIKRLYESKLSHQEIANIFGVKEDTVRRYLSLKKGVEDIKVLLFDIETLMMKVYVWNTAYKQYIPPQNIISDWCCLGWSAKWLFDSDVISDVLTPKEAIKKNDRRILLGIWKLLDEADIIIGHNGDRFDRRKLNYRFALEGFGPTLPYQLIDTMKVSKREFASPSYSLNYLCGRFGLPVKIETDFNLWKECYAGNSDALKRMQRYNENDVVILEEFYLKIRPWIKNHPNIGVYVDTEASQCPNCGSTNLEFKGYYHTPTGRYQAFRCKDCGAIGRARTSVLDKDKRDNLIVSVAR